VGRNHHAGCRYDVLEAAGEHDAAVAAYRTAIDLAPGAPERAYLETRLARL
jgi:predicted RNA polymerase sigma factor